MSLKEEIQFIFQNILNEKIIKKNEQYGSSIDDPINIFNNIKDSQLLIDVRLDDKLSRMQSLTSDDPKYWSEIKEIIAYLLWKIVLHEREVKDESCSGNNRYEGIQIESSEDTGKEPERVIHDAIRRRLSGNR